MRATQTEEEQNGACRDYDDFFNRTRYTVPEGVLEGAASPKANFYAATDLPPNECEGAFPNGRRFGEAEFACADRFAAERM